MLALWEVLTFRCRGIRKECCKEGVGVLSVYESEKGVVHTAGEERSAAGSVFVYDVTIRGCCLHCREEGSVVGRA